MSALTTKRGTGYGHYNMHGADGRKVGEVYKIVTSYNIAPRPITVTSWRYAFNGQRACTTNFRTRAEAVKAAAESFSAAS
jgi:hypothetical protein